MEWLLTNRTLGAAEALQWGVVNRVYPDAESEARVTQVAAQLAAAPTPLQALIKTRIQEGSSQALEDCTEHEIQNVMASVAHPHFRDRLGQFRDKTMRSSAVAADLDRHQAGTSTSSPLDDGPPPARPQDLLVTILGDYLLPGDAGDSRRVPWPRSCLSSLPRKSRQPRMPPTLPPPRRPWLSQARTSRPRRSGPNWASPTTSDRPSLRADIPPGSAIRGFGSDRHPTGQQSPARRLLWRTPGRDHARRCFGTYSA
jgi:hypothetical protein